MANNAALAILKNYAMQLDMDDSSNNGPTRRAIQALHALKVESGFVEGYRDQAQRAYGDSIGTMSRAGNKAAIIDCLEAAIASGMSISQESVASAVGEVRAMMSPSLQQKYGARLDGLINGDSDDETPTGREGNYAPFTIPMQVQALQAAGYTRTSGANGISPPGLITLMSTLRETGDEIPPVKKEERLYVIPSRMDEVIAVLKEMRLRGKKNQKRFRDGKNFD